MKNEEFLERLLLKNPNVKTLEEYVKSTHPIKCQCLKCGLIWNPIPNNLLRGTGCPDCGIIKRAKTQTKNSITFIQEMEKKAPTIKVVGEYAGARNHVMVKCKACGHEWEASPTNLLKGRGCPKCAKKRAADKKRLSEEEFKTLLKEKHPTIDALEKYNGSQERIKFHCLTCDYQWKTSPAGVLSGNACPRCAGNGIYSQEEFIARVNEINPQIEILGDYQRSHTPLLCKCKLCGHKWNSRPGNILSGKGCPKCYHSSTSFIEEAIYESLCIACKDYQILARDRKTIGIELDIFIPELGVAIEPGSWKWHKSKVINDLRKRQMCQEKGIRLITIYTDYYEDNPPFEGDCYVFKETFGFEKDIHALKRVVGMLLDLLKVSYYFTDDDWTQIVMTAYKNSKRRTTSEFVKLIKEIQPQIKVIGEYTGSWNRIAVKCTKCFHSWSPVSNSLLQGSGCPECAKKDYGLQSRKTDDDFKKEIKALGNSITILSDYISSTTKVRCQCNYCGFVWDSLPGNLLQGKGCSKCSSKKAGEKKRKNPALFQKQFEEMHPELDLLTPYVKNTQKVQCKCKLCGHIWDVFPSGLLSGCSCPKCAISKRNKSKCKKVLLVETGDVFESLKAAAKWAKTNPDRISECIRGKRLTANGYHWQFYNEENNKTFT